MSVLPPDGPDHDDGSPLEPGFDPTPDDGIYHPADLAYSSAAARRRRRPVDIAITLVVVAALVAGGIWLIVSRDDPGPETTAATTTSTSAAVTTAGAAVTTTTATPTTSTTSTTVAGDEAAFAALLDEQLDRVAGLGEMLEAANGDWEDRLATHAVTHDRFGEIAQSAADLWAAAGDVAPPDEFAAGYEGVVVTLEGMSVAAEALLPGLMAPDDGTAWRGVVDAFFAAANAHEALVGLLLDEIDVRR